MERHEAMQAPVIELYHKLENSGSVRNKEKAGKPGGRERGMLEWGGEKMDDWIYIYIS